MQRVLWGWSALAIGALALAGVAALLLAVSRLPGIESTFPWPVAFFQKGLVVHVVFSFVVWFLAVFAAMATVTAHGDGWGGTLPPVLAMIAFVLLFEPALRDAGEPSLNNYVPVIVDPSYYAGLAVLAVAAVMAAVGPWRRLWRRRRDATGDTVALAAAGLLLVMALACIARAGVDLGGRAPDHAFNEELFWGGGHVLQFMNVLLLLVAWRRLAAETLSEAALSEGWFRAATAVLLLAPLTSIAFYEMYPAFSAEQQMAFTNLQYVLAPPAGLIAIAVLAAMARYRRREGSLPWGDPAFLALAASVPVFAVGGLLGLFVDGADTRTPAHYHGVIGGIHLAFMGLFYRVLLPALARPLAPGRLVRAQVILFGAGQLMACVGLFWAGGYGAPRKTAGAAQGLEGLGPTIGMGLNGLGALIAVIGGVLFIWTVGRALAKKSPESAAAPL